MDDLQRLGFCFEIKPLNGVLSGCRGTSTRNVGSTTLKVTFKDDSELSKFIIVKAPAAGDPFMIGCQIAQEFGIINISKQGQ